MFGLFFGSSRRVAPAARTTTRLNLESLEARDCPAGPVLSVNVAYGTQHNVTLSGTVTDAQPANLTIRFTGVVTGNVNTDSNGNYSATFTASSLGNVRGRVVDYQNLTGIANATLSNSAPVLSNFVATALAGNAWTFSGQVADEHPEGLTISFSNSVPVSLVNAATTVAADGSFSMTIQMTATNADCGSAVAQISSDWWGTASNQVFAQVTQDDIRA